MAFGAAGVPSMISLRPILHAINAALALACTVATVSALRRRRSRTLCLLRREGWKTVRALRVGFALLLCLVAYSNLKTMIPLIRPGLNDDLLYGIDRAIFLGGHPFRWMNGLEIRGLPDLMVQSYLAFFFLLIYGPIGAILFGSSRRLERVVATYIIAYFAGAAAYLALPAVGPAFASETARIFDSTSGFQIKTALLEMYRGFLTDPRNAPVFPFEGLASLPSLHVAIALLSIHGLRAIERRLAALLVVPLVLLSISTLYLGMHHFLDLPAGVAVALFSLAAVKRLYPAPRPSAAPKTAPQPAPIKNPAFD
jgi:membrane-associated phospholipid phosphatase